MDSSCNFREGVTGVEDGGLFVPVTLYLEGFESLLRRAVYCLSGMITLYTRFREACSEGKVTPSWQDSGKYRSCVSNPESCSNSRTQTTGVLP